MAELPPPYVTNERFKSVSRTLFQLGAALLAAASVKFYSDVTITIETACWIVASVGLMWLGWIILGLLESEK